MSVNLQFLNKYDWDKELAHTTVKETERGQEQMLWIVVNNHTGHITGLSRYANAKEGEASANVRVLSSADGSKPTLELSNISTFSSETQEDIKKVFQEFNKG